MYKLFSMKTIYKIIIASVAMVLGGFALCGGIYLFDTELVNDTMVLLLAIYLLIDGIATFVYAAACNAIFLHTYAAELNVEPEEENEYETAND